MSWPQLQLLKLRSLFSSSIQPIAARSECYQYPVTSIYHQDRVMVPKSKVLSKGRS